jgi:hypothetical protein
VTAQEATESASIHTPFWFDYLNVGSLFVVVPHWRFAVREQVFMLSLVSPVCSTSEAHDNCPADRAYVSRDGDHQRSTVVVIPQRHRGDHPDWSWQGVLKGLERTSLHSIGLMEIEDEQVSITRSRGD